MLYYGLEWESCDTYMQFKEITAPGTPQANEIRQYAKDSGGISTMCWKNDAGTEICLPTGSGSLVTGSGVVNRLAYWTGTSTLDDVPRTLTAGSVLFVHSDFLPQEDNANFFWDDGNNLLTIGTAGSIHGSTGTVRLALDRDDDSVLEISGHGAGKQGVVLLTASRGTHGSKSIVANNDDAGIIQVQAFDGSVYRNLSFIRWFIDGTPGSNDMPGRMSFWTTPDGSGTPAERWRINNAGFLGSSGIDPVTGIDLRGTGSPATQISIERDNGQPNFIGYRVRGGGTATQADDLLSLFGGGGSHTGATADRAISGFMSVAADENWTGTSKASTLRFNTVPTGSTTNVERMRLAAAGHLILPELGTDPGTAQLAADAAIAIYTKNDTLVFAYNNGGTITYIKLALDGSDITWAHDTTAP